MADFPVMKDPLRYLSLPNAPLAAADVLLFPVPYERTVTYKPGTAAGPAALLAASEQLEFFEEDAGWCPTEYIRISVLPEFTADPAETEADFHHRLFSYARSLPRNKLLIALGGEHSITPDLVFSRMPETGTVVQIDAHADLRPSYHGSEFNHACPMFRIADRGYDLVQIGVRSLHAREAAMIASTNRIRTFFDRDLCCADRWRQLLDHLGSLTGPVWLTIDLDGFDPALIPGVGTPQPGGLSWHQGVDVIERLMGTPEVDVRGVDILELVPEPSEVSAMTAAKLVQKCLSFWGKAEGLDQRGPEGSQAGVADE